MTELTTPLSVIIENLRNTFNSGSTRDLNHRIQQLTKLKRMFAENEADILAALKQDLGKSELESFMTEINIVNHEIDYALKRIKKWIKPRMVMTPLSLQPALSYIYKDPLGVILIIGPWNYPVNLIFAPLVGAIAAGNTVLIKPSEISAATSVLIKKLIDRYFDPSFVAVVEGGADVTSEILTHRFDHIFYTGGETVGKIVMTAAAKHLTPVTLELGGKSPCIVDKDIDIDVSTRRIAWGKFINAGQTCVAPDYLLVHESVKKQVVDGIHAAVTDFFGHQPQKSPHFGRIINANHFNRLHGLMKDGDVLFGGNTHRDHRYIAPTLIHNVSLDSRLMSEEIFGPLLPVLTYKNIDEAVKLINSRPKPLALYVFTNDKAVREKVLTETSSGNVCVNDTLMQITSTELPFGGVGTSGMGGYHGKASFNTFTHEKSVLKRFPVLDPFFRYAPFKPYLKWILKYAA